MKGDQIYVRMTKTIKKHFLKRLNEVGYHDTPAQALRLAMLSMIVMDQKELKTFIDQSKMIDMFVMSKVDPNTGVFDTDKIPEDFKDAPYEETTDQMLNDHRGKGIRTVYKELMEEFHEMETMFDEEFEE